MSDDLGQSVRDRLVATAEVMNIVKEKDHIFADVLESGASLPAIVVNVKDSQAEEDLNTSNRLLHPTIDVLAYGRDRKEANALAKVIRDNALPADLRGIVEGMDFKEVTLVAGPKELMDRPLDGTDRWRKLTLQTFTIWALPT